VLGGAWLCGALAAIAEETGWDPGSADYLVGTSAGSMMAALLGAGVPPWLMVAHSAGEALDGMVDARGRPIADVDRSAGAVFRLHRGLPRIGPGSPRLALKTLVAGRRHSASARLAGWLPMGVISTEPLQKTVRRAVPRGWAPHPHLWIVACDYATGRRVVFGREDAPRADLAKAVAASCAIPGFYRPVEIAGRLYVDGGMHSTSNLDVLAGLGLDLVICLNPMSTLAGLKPTWPHQHFAGLIRRDAGRRLGREAKLLKAEGVRTVLIQPVAADLEVMGYNLMSRRRRHQVIARAKATVAEQLREPGLKSLLRGLPPGAPEKIRRPAAATS
jgi:NTE family protein